jgi:hypothetical protein
MMHVLVGSTVQGLVAVMGSVFGTTSPGVVAAASSLSDLASIRGRTQKLRHSNCASASKFA